MSRDSWPWQLLPLRVHFASTHAHAESGQVLADCFDLAYVATESLSQACSTVHSDIRSVDPESTPSHSAFYAFPELAILLKCRAHPCTAGTDSETVKALSRHPHQVQAAATHPFAVKLYIEDRATRVLASPDSTIIGTGIKEAFSCFE